MRQIAEFQIHNSYSLAVFHKWFFFITIQIWWKIRIVVNWLLAIRLLQNSAHATTAQLLWHVQNFVATTFSEFGWEPQEISIKFGLLWNNRQWNAPVLHYLRGVYPHTNFQSIYHGIRNSLPFKISSQQKCTHWPPEHVLATTTQADIKHTPQN